MRGGGCRVVAAMKRNCAAFAIDMSNACGPHGYAAAARLGPRRTPRCGNATATAARTA